MNKIIVFANDSKKAEELCAGAKKLADRVILISSGSETGTADELWQYDAKVSAAMMLPAIAAKVIEEKAELMLCEKSSDGRLAAGYTAAKLGVSPLADVSGLE